MSRGFFHDPNSDPEQYVFGGGQIAATPLQSDRNWTPFLPSVEIQNARGFDPLSCATYGTLNDIEILIRRKYGVERNYSERFLAYATDTHKKGGNDPHYVAEYLRKNGDVTEEEWPFLSAITDFVHYYAAPPVKLYDLAREFCREWTLKHDTVRGLEAMWDALQYSPLGCSVGYNEIDPEGRWFKNGNAPDSHWLVIIGGEYGDHWLAFDSAEPSIKKLRWNMQPQLVKRYSIERTATQEELGKFAAFTTWLAQWVKDNCSLILNTCKAFVSPPTPPELPVTPPNPPTPAPTAPDLLTRFCEAIKQHEGYFPPSSAHPKGTRSWRNRNPGNLKYTSLTKSLGATAQDTGKFCIFPTYEAGFNALCEFVRMAATDQLMSYSKHYDIKKFFSVYAPSADNNNPDAYAKSVAKKLGVDVSFPIKNLIA